MADDEQSKIKQLFGDGDMDSDSSSDEEAVAALAKQTSKSKKLSINDLSESSDSEDDEPRKLVRKKTTKRKPSSSSAGNKKSKKSKNELKVKIKMKKKQTSGGKQDGFIASDDDNEDLLDEYQNQKVYESEEDPHGDDDGTGVPEGQEEEEVDEFEAALARVSRGKGRSKKKELSDEDKRELCNNFIDKMAKAAEADQEDVVNKKPALHKLQMVDEVVRMLSDVNLTMTFVEDCDVLFTLRLWLQPMRANNALPNATVRTAVIKLLKTLPVNKHVLLTKDSDIGKIVNYLRQHKKETPDNKKELTMIMEKWSRMVFDKTDNYAQLEELQARAAYAQRGKDQARRKAMKQQKARSGFSKKGLDSLGARHSSKAGSASADGSNKNKYRATVPQPMVFDFNYRPQESMSKNMVGRKPADPESYTSKLEKRMKTLRKPVQKNKRAVKMSIEGRG